MRDHRGVDPDEMVGLARRTDGRERSAIGARGVSRLTVRVLTLITIIGTSLLSIFELIKQHHPIMYDFRGGLYNAGTAILSGHNPYQPAFLAHQAAIMRAGGMAIGETATHAFSIPVYPAPANIAILPLSALPFWLGAGLFVAISIVAMFLALWLLEIRDWRCYALALASWPFMYAIQIGALGPLLALGIAIVWRWRNALWPPALALASIVVAKVFPWPIAIWMLITKRYRTFALAVGIGVVVTLAAWAVLGFEDMSQYPAMLSNLSYIQEPRAASLVAVLLYVGLPVWSAQILAIATGCALLGIAWRFSRRPGGERQAFALAVMACLTATPIVWDHYMVLLFIPIALISPTVSGLWMLPVAQPFLLAVSATIVPLGNGPVGSAGDTVHGAVVWLVLEAVLLYRLCRTPAERPAAVRRPERRRAPEPAVAQG